MWTERPRPTDPTFRLAAKMTRVVRPTDPLPRVARRNFGPGRIDRPTLTCTQCGEDVAHLSSWVPRSGAAECGSAMYLGERRGLMLPLTKAAIGKSGLLSVNKKGWCEKGYPEGSKGKTQRIWPPGAAPRRLLFLLSFRPPQTERTRTRHLWRPCVGTVQLSRRC